MTGAEALKLVQQEVVKDATAGGNHATMKFSRDVAFGLMKCTRKQLGNLAEEIIRDGLKAIAGKKLFGYTVEVDLAQAGNGIAFS